MGLELPAAPRSNFDLGEREALLARVRAAGFARPLAWYQPMVRDVVSGARYAALVLQTPRWRALLADAPAEAAAALPRRLAELADERLARGEAIGLEALVVVADRA